MTCKERREKRLARGLCADCGNTLDTDGSSCTKCRERRRRKYREDREWYAVLGICPYCRKEKLNKGEKMCLECREKGNEQNRRKYENMSTEKKVEYLKKDSEAGKRIYRERKESGICVKCGKRKAEKGKVMCSICLGKKRNRARRLYQEMHDILPREDRIAYGLCYICGEPLDGNRDWKVCSRCHERLAENMHKNRRQKSEENDIWKRENELIFNSQMRKYCETGTREEMIQCR